MRFRPLPLLTLLAIPALALLIWLGIWQLERAEWKQARIEGFEAARTAPARPLSELLCAGSAPFARPAIAPARLGERRIAVYGRDSSGAQGWRIFQTAPVPACATGERILVETGFRPLNGEIRPVSAPSHLYVPPPRPGAFTPEPDIEDARFYAFQHEAIARALGLEASGLHAKGWLAVDDGKLPAVLADVPPARHIGYAITWFGLAFALIAVYLAFHAARGRLAFTRKKD